MRCAGMLVALTIAACGEDLASGPFDGLPLDGVFDVDVGAPVHMARDRQGVAHIYAETFADAMFVQGYVTAHDRLPQMDVLRRYGAGTLAELYGQLDPAVIDSDLEMRMHRMKPLAEQTLALLRASTDPADARVVQMLERFASGVNRYAADLQHGLWTIDPNIPGIEGFDAAQFVPWSPVDSLVIARFFALSQSWTVPFELDATELYQGLRETFDAAPAQDAAKAARRGISRDLLKLAPAGTASTIPGFPNVATDSGSRSDGTGVARRRPGPLGTPTAATAVPSRPHVPQQLFDDARGTFGGSIRNGPLGSLGSHAWLWPHAGGTSFATGPALARGGRTMLAADQQLPLGDPSLFYPTHVIVQRAPQDGDQVVAVDELLDLFGVTIPGIPGVLFGETGTLAWSGTASEHDVNDIYLEQIVPCETGACVAWTDPQGFARSVAIERFTESIQIGTRGVITGAVVATYEVVPHHGPIIPAIDRANHQLVPRTASTALSVRYTGYQPSFELTALYKLARARTVEDGFGAVADMHYGSQSFVLIDVRGHIGWTTHAAIPVRKPAAYAWDPDVHQDGLAPFLVLPGAGDGDWLDPPLSPRVVPHAIDPPQGYLIAANADPVGATFDGLPLDQGTVAGQPLYAGVAYAAGLRDQRIAQLLGQLGTAATVSDVASVLRDTRSNAGAVLTPAILAALSRLDRQNLTPFDVNPYLDALAPADLARLATARALLAGWTFQTPAPANMPDDDSTATTIFHAWMHCFIERAFKDELDAIGFDVWRLDGDRLVRLVYAVLTDPGSFVTSPSTQQPILCDNYLAADPDDSCTKVILQAMIDAMTYLESPAGFGTPDPRAWTWRGDGVSFVSIPGDNSSVSRVDPGWQDLDFSQLAAAPALRFVAEGIPGAGITVKWALPGGVIEDSRSPHHRDLLAGYVSDTLLDAAISIDEIVRAGESRWVFH